MAKRRRSYRPKTARQIAASKYNLFKARAVRHRAKIGVGVLAAGAGAGVLFGAKIRGAPRSAGPAKMLGPGIKAIGSGHPNRAVLNASNYAHTPEAIRVRKRRYYHGNKGYTGRKISEAEAHRRTQTYVGTREMFGHRVSNLERSRTKQYYRGRTV